jgi:dephospho-CoA kinase
VFSNKKQLDKLNKIMIPIMQSKIASLKATNKLIFVELAIYMYHVSKFKKYFTKVIYISNKKNIPKNIFLKKFSNVKKLPTNAVGKNESYTHSMKTTCCYVVENYENKKNLEKKIKNFLIRFKK